MKTIKFYTLGCKVNQYETQLIREQFLSSGFQEISNGKAADIYLINTCTVTQKADADSLKFIRRVKRENPKAKIVVTGCLAELDAHEIRKIGGVSLIVKNKEKEHILKYSFFLNSQTRKLANSQTISSISYFKGHTRAFLKIQDGCDNSCSYCKVPLVRTRFQSKPISEIIQEAESLVKNGFTPLETIGKQGVGEMSLTGFKEIVLCGICLGSYGKDLAPRTDLVEVISALENIKRLLRIRLSSIEAGDVSDALLNKMATSEKLCRHLHIPIQSGDDEILRKMNRSYSYLDYLNLIRKVKILVPEIAITTDVIVGFPGESEVHFNNTVNIIKEILPLKVHIFPYSKRKGTPAADNFRNEVNPATIKERIFSLKEIAEACALTYKKQFLNKNIDVLIEGRAKNNLNLWEGYSDNYIKVFVKSKQNLKNQLLPMKLKSISRHSVFADLC